MSYLLIPNEATSNSAVIWLAAIQESAAPEDLKLRFNNRVFPLDTGWVTYQTRSGRNTVIYQYKRIENLVPAKEYIFELINFDESKVLSRGSLRTLPDRLPMPDEKPFTVLLGSCFAASKDGSSALGAAYMSLRRKFQIDLKILCGDQVYLDDPALHFLTHKHTFEDLEEILLANYVKTWTQGAGSSFETTGILTGYRNFLQNGANFFCADDHEFWNNAPNWASLIRDSWSQMGRDNWKQIARHLLEMFQSGKPTVVFKVGELSFFLADTRINRDADRLRFMDSADLNLLENWVQNLTAPGVLVVGQPVFSGKAGIIKGSFGDWNLPDYVQYEDLARILSKTKQSIVVLTGDVHYGRIAYCQLEPGTNIYEIISSPTALINEKVGGSWEKAPDKFPAFSVPGVVSKPIVNDFDYQFTDDHFLLLEFSREAGGKIKMVLKVCYILPGGQMPNPIKIGEFKL